MQKRIKVLRDIVHNYIYLTPIDELIINTSKFQRLRYITQNSLAYLTYPSNGINRFSHSLGVMHLGGEMFKRSMENAPLDDLEEFIKLATDFLKSQTSQLELNYNHVKDVWIKTFGNVSGFNHFPEGKKGNINDDQRFVINVLWQSTRIACIIHDIGHYPYSHLFESAFDNYKTEVGNLDNPIVIEGNLIRERYDNECRRLGVATSYSIPLHEMNGVHLLLDLFPNSIDTSSGTQEIVNLARLCSSIGKLIFIVNKDKKSQLHPSPDANSSERSVIQCLHTIISSEIDADRLDYCIRDAKCSGVELGAIDITRIVNSLKLQNLNGNFEIVLSQSSLSGIEEFFHQRYLLYKYIIYHHNVVRLNGVLEEILKVFFSEVGENKPTELRKILVENDFWDEDQNHSFKLLSSLEFEFYDDAWLKTLIGKVYVKIKSNLKYKELIVLIETFLFRKMDNIVSMWKRETDIKDTIEDICVKLDSGKKKATLLGSIKNEDEREKKIIKLLNDWSSYPDFKVLVDKLKKELKQEGVMLIVSNCPPKIFAEHNPVKIAIKNGSAKNAHDISYYLASLKNTADATIIPRFAFVKEGIKLDAELFVSCKKITLEHLTKYVRKRINE